MSQSSNDKNEEHHNFSQEFSTGPQQPAKREANENPVTPPDPATVRAQSGLTCLVMLLRFHEYSVNPERIVHEFANAQGSLGVQEIIRCAKSIGLKARRVDTKFDRLEKTPLPAIAVDNSGGFFVIAKATEEEALVVNPVTQRPQKLSRTQLGGIWSGELVLLTRRAGLFGAGDGFDISWFIPALMKYKRIFAEVLVASFFLQLFALVTPVFFQVIMDKVLVHRSMTTLDVLIIGLITVGVFEAVVGGLRTYVFAHTTNRVDVMLGTQVFDHLIRLPMAYFQARRVGDSVARVRELETIRDFLTGSFLTLVIDVFFTFVFLAVMYIYSSTLFWIVLASLPLYAALSLGITPTLKRRVDEKFRRGAENQAFLVESITGIETLKAMAVEPQMQRRWEEQIAGYVGASFRASNLNNIANQTAQMISKVTTALILFIGAKAVMSGDLTVGQLVAFNMLAGRVSGPVLRLTQLWQNFQQARISVDRLGDILNTKAEPKYTPGKGTPPPIKGDVRFNKVDFRYRPDGELVLTDVSLDVPAGQVIGIVGPSGSGKSTFTKLVQRMYVPERGQVSIDGLDLSLFDPAWLRQQIGVVLQDETLFNRSIRENIALANPSMSLEDVMKAAKLAGAHEFILQLPDGYDTQIGERGASLSGGQRQRIAIARALANNPRILIFDEATSALDYESEHIIQKNMRDICKGRTVFIIAHRLAAVRDADRIITIEAGKITEDGPHEELLAADGRYAMLYRIQSGELSGEDSDAA